MLLSEILEQIPYTENYKIINEKPFSYLALSASSISDPNCTFLDSEKYIDNISESVTMVLTVDGLAPKLMNGHYGLCVVEQPRELFFTLHNFLSNKEGYRRESYKTLVGKGCNISSLSYISDANVTIGNNVTIEEFVSIKENVVIGDNSIIRAGTIVGGEGFEFKRFDGGILPVKHLGGVIIGESVELQQNNCVDKAIYPWDDTVVGDNCKTDNMVYIAHAVKMKRNVLIAAHTCVAGRVVMEEDVWIGPGVTLINGMHIGKSARVNIGSVATKSVADYESVTGNFAIPHQQFIENLKKSTRKVDE